MADDGFLFVKKKKSARRTKTLSKRGLLPKSSSIQEEFSKDDFSRLDTVICEEKWVECDMSDNGCHSRIISRVKPSLRGTGGNKGKDANSSVPRWKKLQDGQYWNKMKKLLEELKLTECVADGESAVTASNSFVGKNLVCYGVGHFASCLIARQQLTLSLLLREAFQIPPKSCYIYDPVYTVLHYKFLEEYLELRPEGKRLAEDPSVFYMPHCGKALYNNLLWRNWNRDNLRKLVIIGNSFNHMNESTPRRILEIEAAYILKILPYTEEHPIPNLHEHSDVFNNTSVHFFPEHRLCHVSEEFWLDNPEPQYPEDVEIELQTK